MNNSKIINFFKQNYFEAIIITIVFLGCFINSFNGFGVAEFSDSPAYISNIIMVAPLYPLILDFLQWIFGEENFRAITMAQFFITFPILALAMFKISKLLDVSKVLTGFILIFIGISFHMFCLKIMTEAFAYPLFYLVFAYTMEAIIKKSPKSFILALIFNVVLYLIRSQFIILFPLLLILFVILCFNNKEKWLKPKLLFVFSASIIVAGFFNQSANYFLHGKFIGPQGGGIVLMASPSYFMEKDDVNLFKDDLTKEFYIKYFDKMQQINAIKSCDKSKWQPIKDTELDNIAKAFPNWTSENYNRWKESLNDLTEKNKQNYYKTEIIDNKCIVIDDENSKTIGDLYSIFAILSAFNYMGINDWKTIGPITSEIGIKLRVKHFKEWFLESYVGTTYSNAGGEFLVILSLIVFFSIFSSYRETKSLNSIDIFLIMSVIIHISLVVFVSFIAMIHDRYFVYSFLLILCTSVLVLEKLRLKYCPNF
jgi:hypothetical protein